MWSEHQQFAEAVKSEAIPNEIIGPSIVVSRVPRV